MTRVILVRHGQSQANIDEVFAGITDTHLTPRGEQQAAAIARYLAAHEKIDKIYASDLTRVQSTVAPTAKAFDLPVINDTALREIYGGAWENQPYHEIKRKYLADFNTWIHEPRDSSPTKGESVRELYARVIGRVREIAAENNGKTVLVGSHLTPVRALLVEALFGTVEEYTRKVDVPNASLHILRYENGKFTPEKISITEHLGGDPL